VGWHAQAVMKPASSSAKRLSAAGLAVIALASAQVSAATAPDRTGGGASPRHMFGGDYPSFRQEAGDRVSLYASNPGSRRWTCDARWAGGAGPAGGPVSQARAMSFHVHPHSRDELVGSVRPDGDAASLAAPADVRCRTD
jgi:hypothetical protein